MNKQEYKKPEVTELSATLTQTAGNPTKVIHNSAENAAMNMGRS